MSYNVIIKQNGKVRAKITVKDKAEADSKELTAKEYLKTNRLAGSFGFTIETEKAQIMTP